jgi:ABC-2 type transport system permease protein
VKKSPRFDGRFATAFQIARVSNTMLSTVPSAITTLVVRPLLGALLLVAVLGSVGVTDLRDAAYASIVLSFGMAVMLGAVMHVSSDRMRGVSQEIIGYGLWNPPYWTSKLLIPMILGIVPAVLSSLVIFWISGIEDVTALLRVLTLIPIAALVGALIGITAAITSFAFSDPYMVSNVLNSVIMITAGVVLPLQFYPTWLAWIARFLPFTALVEAVRSTGPIWPYALRELAIAVVWLLAGILIARRVMSLVRSGKLTEEIW